jgi:hypothetical protein
MFDALFMSERNSYGRVCFGLKLMYFFNFLIFNLIF